MSDTLQRQWAMLRMIPRAPRKIAATVICARLDAQGMGATLRTVQRDLHTLSSSFPIVSDQSKPIGWSWRADAAVLDIPGMDGHTALTFALVQSYMQKLLPTTTLGHMAPWFSHAEDVLKTGGAMVARWKDKVRVITKSPSLQSPTINPEVQAVVYDCLMQGAQLLLTYQAITKNEAPKTYPAHPLGIVVREQVVYLVCTIKEHIDVRFLAMHRISSAQALEKSARVPEGFDLDKVAARDLAMLFSDEPMVLQMRVSKLVAKYLEETPLSADQQLIPQEDGRVFVQATVENSVRIRNWIHSLSKDCTVIAPQFLLEEQVTVIKEICKNYEKWLAN